MTERRTHWLAGGEAAHRCAMVRESLSARLDGEVGPLEASVVDEHLAGCGTCRRFEVGLAELTRAIRVRPLDPVPDRACRILEAAGCAAPRAPLALLVERRWLAWHGPKWLRVGRWAAAAAPLLAVVPALALGVVAHTHVDPSQVSTPCTAWLVHHGLHGVGPGAVGLGALGPGVRDGAGRLAARHSLVP